MCWGVNADASSFPGHLWSFRGAAWTSGQSNGMVLMYFQQVCMVLQAQEEISIFQAAPSWNFTRKSKISHSWVPKTATLELQKHRDGAVGWFWRAWNVPEHSCEPGMRSWNLPELQTSDCNRGRSCCSSSSDSAMVKMEVAQVEQSEAEPGTAAMSLWWPSMCDRSPLEWPSSALGST